MSDPDSPPARVRRAYAEWARPQRGSANPEDMTNDLWVWLVETEASAYAARKVLGGDAGAEPPPGWCFSRFGMASVTLDDGTELCIAGEHEDAYDPDFYIYNDVIVKDAAGDVRILGYPEAVFPPTDFHTATLVGDRIVLIGNLGYHDRRRSGETPVFSLDIRSLAIAAVPCCGSAPDWLHRHEAHIVEDGAAIECHGGAVLHPGLGMIVENIERWRFDLRSGAWARTHAPDWTRWAILRADGKPLSLWRYEAMLQSARSGRESPTLARIRASFEKEGRVPDLGLYERRHAYQVDGGALSVRREARRAFRGEIDGLAMRFREEALAVFVTVEGVLAGTVTAEMRAAGVAILEALEAAPCKSVDI